MRIFHSYKLSLYSYVVSYLTLYSYRYVAIAMYLGHQSGSFIYRPSYVATHGQSNMHKYVYLSTYIHILQYAWRKGSIKERLQSNFYRIEEFADSMVAMAK